MPACREYLQQPFIFLSCDTLVEEKIPAPDENWMAFAEAADIRPYRTVEIEDGWVRAVCEKGIGALPTHQPYIGLAGIRDYRQFWSAMSAGGAEAIETGEAFGLRFLLPNGIRAHRFTWHDTGNPDALAQTRSRYRRPDDPNILDKANEAIWFVGDVVIKFSDDRKFIANRVKRVGELGDFVPEVTGAGPHMYRYVRVEGKVLSEVANLPRFQCLLQHSQRFWTPCDLSGSEREHFRANCMKFYRDKTLERVALFYRNFSRQDGSEPINGVEMSTLEQLLGRVDWAWLAEGAPSRFHGDFHFENILCTRDERFVFLDWRQDFGGDLSIGDVYYDLAKLLHGLIISHELVARDLFCVDWRDDGIDFDVHRKQSLVECEQYFNDWLGAHGYDARKVRVLTALIYLNIAALHHHPYSLLLYALGKSMLHSEMER